MKEVIEYIFGMSMAEMAAPSFIIAQVIGLLTTIVSVTSAQFRNLTAILILELIANLLVASSFVLLGGSSGAYVCIAACVQTAICYIYARREEKVPQWMVAIFVCAYNVISVYTYRVPIDMLSGVCAMTFAYAVAAEKPSEYRIYILVNSLLWIIYDIQVKAFTNVITHGLLLISIIVAIFRYDIKRYIKRVKTSIKK